ncbi:MAG TPA: aldehyde dehydrogenase family protein [Actinocrinis sp.]|jgi:acyl-CoA reductase-like NAD-dependent aldehyde dehydrogenase|uniref:aldehyde dehydrogenase family protein n=1 Tax=Actinocrinis sp. TaxID=1920516 RepID=UPI002DDCEAAE|nr:aldehyde dehydrogenase family protein [Actinocrinis sp.]HEV3172534.1 aldehyde dehydrogenase family protein [Actinocrinis sp.]
MTTEAVTTPWSSDRESDRFAVENPAYGTVLAYVQGAGPDEVDKAAHAAQAGFERWSRRSAIERGTLLLEAARVIRENADELAALESAENGKPVRYARAFDIETCIAIFEFFGRAVRVFHGEARDSGTMLDFTEQVPYGVVGAIVPFNWPPIHTAGKIAPALAAGNAVLIKPGEQAPLASMRVAELVRQVLPDDVVHVVPGRAETGAAIASHPLVRKISFTGAPTTGTAVIRSAAANLTPTLMELGGKNPFVVFEDADLDSAARWALDAGFYNQGEACTAGSRLIVQRSVYDEFVERLAPQVAKLVVGDGSKPGTHVGPLVTKAQMDRVLGYLKIGADEGAVVAAEAALPTDPELADGFFVAPTLLTGVHPDMRVAKEEIFGPVAVVIPFDDEEDAVRIANGTDFGLVGGVFSGDQPRAIRVGRRIEAGLMYVNHYNRMAVGTPFGGTKHSGFGREHTLDTLREFTYAKTLRIPSGEGEITGVMDAV